MEIGRPTIHPLLFYTGKFAGYAIWVLLVGALLGKIDLAIFPIIPLRWVAFMLLFCGIVFSVGSMVNLGKSTSLGLPEKSTTLQTDGLYRISRNPMYVGFNLLTLAGVAYLQNVFILGAALYSIYIYHRIILNEEKFLENRFGAEYLQYKAKVRRYL